MPAQRLGDLAATLKAELLGDAAREIVACNTLEDAGPAEVSFLANPKYAKRLGKTKAGAVVVGQDVTPDMVPAGVALLRVRQPYVAFMKAVVAIHGYRTHPHAGVHPKAHVERTATIGEGTVIYPFAYVGANAVVGRDCVLFPGVVVYDGCVLGDRVTLHANTVVGQDGFGYATHPPTGGVHHKIPQVGNAVICDDVEIGAGCAIDRATLGSTVVGKGTKFSNHVSVGHGTRIGEHCLLVAQVGLAGSVKLGHHVTIAGQSAVAGHLTVGDNVTIAGQTGVTNDVPAGATVMGFPATDAPHARRVLVLHNKLPQLFERVRGVERKRRSDEATERRRE